LRAVTEPWPDPLGEHGLNPDRGPGSEAGEGFGAAAGTAAGAAEPRLIVVPPKLEEVRETELERLPGTPAGFGKDGALDPIVTVAAPEAAGRTAWAGLAAWAAGAAGLAAEAAAEGLGALPAARPELVTVTDAGLWAGAAAAAWGLAG
jgi:hypothetical protein